MLTSLFRSPRLLAAVVLLMVCCTGTVAENVAVPSYFYPGSLWTQMDSGYPTESLAIINPNSGPGASKDSNYANQVVTSQAAGLHVLGYVYTSYGSRSI